jgi:ATP-binding cassette, subfamily C (CFTR/MRP), member 1
MIGSRQADWSAATQKRISMTSEILMEIKSIKMMGLDDIVTKILQAERVRETKQMERFTWVIVWMNVICQYVSQTQQESY